MVFLRTKKLFLKGPILWLSEPFVRTLILVLSFSLSFSFVTSQSQAYGETCGQLFSSLASSPSLSSASLPQSQFRPSQAQQKPNNPFLRDTQNSLSHTTQKNNQATPFPSQKNTRLNLLEELSLNPNFEWEKRIEQFIESKQKTRKVLEAKNNNFITQMMNPQNQLFVIHENAILREMNEALFYENKSLADAITYHAQELFRKEFLSDESIVSTSSKEQEELRLRDLVTIESYDFKQARFALTGILPENKTEILKAIRNASYRASERLTEDLFRAEFLGEAVNRSAMRGLSESPRKWFQVGIGSNIEEASFAARQGRTRPQFLDSDNVTIFQNVQDLVQQQLDASEKLRIKILDLFKQRAQMVSPSVQAEIFILDSNGVPLTISRNIESIFNRTRTQGRDLEAYLFRVSRQLLVRYGIELNTQDLTLIQNYFNATNSFAPSLIIGVREIPVIQEVPNGLLSFDMVSISARDSERRRLALIGATPKNVLQRVRLAEREVTSEIFVAKSKIKGAFRGEKVITTGDEGLIHLSYQPSQSDLMSIAQEMNAHRSFDIDFRTVYVHPKRTDGRSLNYNESREYATHGESLQKSLVIRLEEDLNGVDYTKESTMLIEIKAKASSEKHIEGLSGSEVKIYLTKSPAEDKLTPILRSILSELKSRGIRVDRNCVLVIAPNQCVGF